MPSYKMKQLFLVFLFFFGTISISQTVNADNYSYIKDEVPYVYDLPSMTDGKAIIQWMDYGTYVEAGEGQLYYELELADNERFSGAKQYSANLATLAIDKTELGKHGGKFYVRVRYVLQLPDEVTPIYSQWSEKREFTFVAINKKNFPGLYKVLKNGGKRYDLSANKTVKIIYDKNGDGWLDPAEIDDIWMIGTRDTVKTVNGVRKIVKATNISSFQGVEYFHKLSYIHIARFSGTKADFSKSSVDTVWMTGVSSKQITVVSPTAREVHVEADYNTKLTKMDLSKCSNAVEIDAYGNASTKTLKLPKNKKKLKILSVSDINAKSLNMNAYTKLQQLYVYRSDVKSVKVNKCKNLRYIYFYYCDNIKNLNLNSNKKLRGADFYQTPGLTKTTVKRPKNGKYTWNKGKWWYGTSAYNKDMKKLYD